MSTGQIAQRPYSSFRTKYAINSSPVLGARMSSYTNKSRNVPLRPISSTTNKTITDDLLKPLNKAYSKTTNNNNNNNNGDRTTTVSNAKQEITSKTTKTTSSSSWNNKLFYSSTRTYASKSFNFIENNKLMNKHRASSTTIHSKSPNSSGTSVESIVPKYGQSISSNGQSKNMFNGSQKRAYNTAKALKENVPNVNSHKKTLISNPSSNNAITSNRKHIKENVNTFSSKFPNGLPFEDEFYRKGRSYSGASDASKISSYSSYEQSLPFEDEFSRKPSNEPLYVDFTKSIPININTKQQKMHLNANYFNKFDNISRDSNKSQDQPVVYVAVASWVPKCNEIHSKEPMNKDCM